MEKNSRRMPMSAVALCCAVVLSGCAHQSGRSIEQDKLPVPKQWQSDATSLTKHDSQWLNDVVNEDLQPLLEQALTNNFELKRQALALQAQQQTVKATGAELWPSLELGLSVSEREAAGASSSVSNNELSATLRYEADIWGKLSAQAQQANLTLASQTASYELQKRQLVANVILAWYQHVEAAEQLALFEQRLANAKQNLAIIESGYQSGLNSALDVYLSRNDVASEQSRVAGQRATVQSSIRSIELLLGSYPTGQLNAKSNAMPKLSHGYRAQLPSDVVANNLTLKSSWLALLAADSGTAYAHKQRFPSLSLTASIGTASEDLGSLLSQSTGWSLLGNLTAPLFNAGRLQAIEERARLQTAMAEQAYLTNLHNTFAEIENRLTQEQSLRTSLTANAEAASNAERATELSFEQYLKGLVSYTTVLDAQTRAFNAQSALIQSQYQLLENRLQLHLALGGDFATVLAKGSH